MDYTYIIIGVLVIASLAWTLFLKPKFQSQDILTQDQLDLIDFACQKGVEYAEQLYKNDPTLDRKQLAIDLAWEIIQKAGIVPDNYKFIIKGLIESAVKNLPKTHDENGKIII